MTAFVAWGVFSDDWLIAINDIDATIAWPLRLDVVVTDGDGGSLVGSVDTSSGRLVVGRGSLANANVSVTTDDETAVAMIRSPDPETARVAFLSGKVVIQGDLMPLIAFGQALRSTPEGAALAEAIRALTA